MTSVSCVTYVSLIVFTVTFPSTSPTYIISSIFTSTIDSSIGNANLCISAVTSPAFISCFVSIFACFCFYTSLMSVQYVLHQMALKYNLTHLPQMPATHIDHTQLQIQLQGIFHLFNIFAISNPLSSDN